MAFACGAPYGRLGDPDASAAEGLIEGVAVLAVTVADKEPHAVVGEARARLRACWETHALVGLVDQAPSQARRLSCAMKNNT